MRIAITADVHLSARHPERANAFRALIETIRSENIHTAIIAGDLLDANEHDAHIFDAIATAYPEITFHILPGNHDEGLSEKYSAAKNRVIYTRPTLLEFEGVVFAFIPYQTKSTMSEALALLFEHNAPFDNRFVLVSHGDFGLLNREVNGEEAGYFPLTNRDLEIYRPLKTILGHIHKPNALESVAVYPGSPYPLNETETGQRRFLIYDTGANTLIARALSAPPVYANLTIPLIPAEYEEEEFVQTLTDAITNAVMAYEGENANEALSFAITLYGVTSLGRDAIAPIITRVAKTLRVKIRSLSLRRLSYAVDDARAVVARETKKRIDALALSIEGAESVKERAAQIALERIYGIPHE